MTVIDRGRRFAERLRGLTARTSWEERRCPSRRGHETWKLVARPLRAATMDAQRSADGGRATLLVPPLRCRRRFTPERARVERGRWYGRDVRRLAIDHRQYVGSSLAAPPN